MLRPLRVLLVSVAADPGFCMRLWSGGLGPLLPWIRSKGEEDSIIMRPYLIVAPREASTAYEDNGFGTSSNTPD